jgi:glycosyltransferase involved in cell wall biosynthesis
MNDQIHIFEIAKSTAGVGEYIRWIAKGLDPSRFRLTVACLSEGGPELAAELEGFPGVRAFSMAMNRYQVDPLSDARVAIQLRQMIRRERFDLIHAHASKPGFLARLAAAGSGVPVIYSPHCFAFHQDVGRLQASAIAAIERLAARYLTERIITVSDGERDLALRNRVGRADQITTIHSGIDTRPFDRPLDRAAQRAALGVPPEAPLVGTVGRFNPQKAPLDFIRAAVIVHARRPEVHFIWIGSGPLETEARAAVAAQGLADVFHFAGQRADVPDSMRAFDIFVLSSRWEGFPLTVLEAMAGGVSVVATRVMGTAEAVQDGETGLLIAPGAPEELAYALLTLLDDPACAQSFGARGRERIEQQFTREMMLTQLAQVYQEVYERLPRNRRRRNIIEVQPATVSGSTQQYPLQERTVTAPRREQ